MTFLENKELAAVTIILLLLSILCRFSTGIFMNTLIRETENMSVARNRFLKQCKIRFRNCYQMNDGVPNVPVFVDKALGRIPMGRFSVEGISHLAGQLMLLSVTAAGIGACKAIIDKKAIVEILPYYLLSFLGLYLYFSVTGLVDLDGKKERLKAGVTDYLENHLAPRLAVLEESELAAGLLEEEDPGEDIAQTDRPVRQGGKRAAGRRTQEAGDAALQAGGRAVGIRRAEPEEKEKSLAEQRTEEQVFTKTQEKELEELLKEFFA